MNRQLVKTSRPKITITVLEYLNRLREYKSFTKNFKSIGINPRKRIGSPISKTICDDLKYINRRYAETCRNILAIYNLIYVDRIPIVGPENKKRTSRTIDDIDISIIVNNLVVEVDTTNGNTVICHRFGDPNYPLMPLYDYMKYLEMCIDTRVINRRDTIALPTPFIEDYKLTITYKDDPNSVKRVRTYRSICDLLEFVNEKQVSGYMLREEDKSCSPSSIT